MNKQNVMEMCLDALLKENLRIQKTNKFKATSSPGSYIKDFCKVQLGNSRCSGHTTTIIKQLHKWKNPVVICKHSHMIDQIKATFSKELEAIHWRVIFTTPEMFMKNVINKTYPDIVFLDCASYIDYDIKEEILDCCAIFPLPFIIVFIQ